MVGDANQTIYSFAGATPDVPARLPPPLPRAPCVVRLDRDYRSTPQVVELANRLVGAAASRRPACTLVGQRPDGPAPTFAEYDDEPAEAADGRRAVPQR